MLSTSSELSKPPLQIKQDGKFYSRLLSKETSLASPSFRVYYGVAPGAVPFLWESQPGTPKQTICIADLPPLTPPPSYYYKTKNKNSKKSHKSSRMTMLPKLRLGKSHRLHSSSQSFSTSSVSSSSSVSSNHDRRPSSSRTSFSSMGDDEESNDGSPTSTLCLGIRHRAAGGLRGMKNMLWSTTGHGSDQGTAV